MAIGKSREDIASVRRTTLKPRNPGNAPDPADEKVLKMLESATSLPEEHIEWTEGIARYYKPLMIREVCLNCHGPKENFVPELTDALAKLYPGDQANGYKLGDLRGVIRVDVKRKGQPN